MWWQNGTKLLFLLMLVAVSYAVGWNSHDWVQRASHQRAVSAGDELRFELSSQAKLLDKIASRKAGLKNQQATAFWELKEYRQRSDKARSELSADRGYSLSEFARDEP